MANKGFGLRDIMDCIFAWETRSCGLSKSDGRFVGLGPQIFKVVEKRAFP